MDYEKFLENQEKAEKGQNNQYKKMITPIEDQEILIRLLPNLEEENGAMFARHFIHKGFTDPEYGNKKVLRCLGKNCPLCHYSRNLDDKAKKARCVYIFQGVLQEDIGEYAQKGEVVTLETTTKLYNMIMDAIKAEFKDKVNVLDLKEGITLSVKRYKKSDDRVDYLVEFVGEPVEITTEQLDFAKNTKNIKYLFTNVGKEVAQRYVQATMAGGSDEPSFDKDEEIPF